MSSSFFTQIGSDIDGEAADDYSGKSVSLSSDGSVVAIGAPYNGGNSGYAEGRAKDDFDEWGYLASNTDLMTILGSNTTEAIKHYISSGISEGRLTNIFNADLKSAFGNDHALATKHYVEIGFSEGRIY